MVRSPGVADDGRQRRAAMHYAFSVTTGEPRKECGRTCLTHIGRRTTTKLARTLEPLPAFPCYGTRFRTSRSGETDTTLNRRVLPPTPTCRTPSASTDHWPPCETG